MITENFRNRFDLFIEEQSKAYMKEDSSRIETYERQIFSTDNGGGEFFIKWLLSITCLVL